MPEKTESIFVWIEKNILLYLDTILSIVRQLIFNASWNKEFVSIEKVEKTHRDSPHIL